MKRRNVIRGAAVGGIAAVSGGAALIYGTNTTLATSHDWEVDESTTIETADGDVQGIVMDDDTQVWASWDNVGYTPQLSIEFYTRISDEESTENNDAVNFENNQLYTNTVDTISDADGTHEWTVGSGGDTELSNGDLNLTNTNIDENDFTAAEDGESRSRDVEIRVVVTLHDGSYSENYEDNSGEFHAQDVNIDEGTITIQNLESELDSGGDGGFQEE